VSTLPVMVNFENSYALTLMELDTALTMDRVAEFIAPHFIGRTQRPRPPEQKMRVRLQDGEALPPGLTVQQAGWVKFDVVEVFFE
jgi:hypothetical protein